MTWLIHVIVSFLIQALTLKLAIGVVSDNRDNTYSTALSVSAVLAVLGLMLSFIPFFGWLAYMVIWIVIVANTYRIGTLRSVGVALVQMVVHLLIIFGLKLVGWAL